MRWLANMQAATTMLGAPDRLIHIGDRENDIYEFFCATQEAGPHFLVRTCVDRLAGDGGHTIAAEMAEVALAGHHRVEVGDGTTAEIALRYKRIHVLPPIGKQKRYPALDLTIIQAREEIQPDDRPAVDWKLITDLPVASAADAVRMLRRYGMRWKIETFHKILKSGCRAEEARLRTAERLVNLVAIFCILAWLFWLTMINRAAPKASPRARRGRDHAPRPARFAIPARWSQEDAHRLSDPDRPPRQLSRSRSRPAARQHRDVARLVASH
jgi:hypothetical protein